MVPSHNGQRSCGRERCKDAEYQIQLKPQFTISASVRAANGRETPRNAGSAESDRRMGNAGTAPVASFCPVSSRSEALSTFAATVGAPGVLGAPGALSVTGAISLAATPVSTPDSGRIPEAS